MAVESRIDAEDDWFVGEDRVLRFTFVAGDVSDVADWTLAFQLYARRAADGDAPLLVIPATGHPATATEPAYALVTVAAGQTEALGAGFYQFVLRRTDPGAVTVLSFGPAQLRSAVTA